MTLVVAKYFKRIKNNNVQCTLCPNYCIIKDRQYGKCLVRKNFEGTLYSEAYSNLCAINIDPIEKKPLFHFLAGTKTLSIAFGGCNLKCLNCQNFSISQSKPTNVEQYIYNPNELVNLAKEKKLQSISYTYTEPLVSYEYTYDTAFIAKEKGIKNILVTAGYINEEPLFELLPLIDAANIDIKSFDEKTYSEINQAKLSSVLNTILIFKKYNVWIELTYLLIPNINDNEKMIDKFASWLISNNLNKVPIHISRFFPNYKLNYIEPTSVISIEFVVTYLKSKGILYVYSGNLNSNVYENTFCPNCNRIIISRLGFFIKEFNIENNKCKFCNSYIDGFF